jgi:hypothetical protein
MSRPHYGFFPAMRCIVVKPRRAAGTWQARTSNRNLQV